MARIRTQIRNKGTDSRVTACQWRRDKVKGAVEIAVVIMATPQTTEETIRETINNATNNNQVSEAIKWISRPSKETSRYLLVE